MKNDEAMRFATARCDAGDAKIAECACDALCACQGRTSRHRTRVKNGRSARAGEGARASRL